VGIILLTMKGPLRELLKDLTRAAKKARKRGRPEDWHRLRTTSRHLRGALIAHADGLDPEEHRRVSREAKQITKLPTKVRDLDVALENLQSLRAGARSDAERLAARRGARAIGKKREKDARQARRRLDRKRPVAKLSRHLKKMGVSRGQAGPTRAALESCAEEVLRRRSALRGWDHVDEVHRLRVAVKKYRSALMATNQHHPALGDLQRVQQVLGEHHDWSELAGRLAKLGSKKRHGAGYRTLAARARQEQRIRYELYQHDLDERLPRLVSAHHGRLSLVA
jgi:CHAD domain-containing protein